MEEIIDSKLVFSGTVFNVNELKIRLENSEIVVREIVDKQQDSVAVVPIDENGNILLVKEYFCGTNERALTLPKGMINRGETPEVAALRELQEEVGYKGSLSYLTKISVSPGYLTQKTTLFYATNLEVSKRKGDEEHYLSVIKIPFSEAMNKVLTGEITESRTVCGILLANSRVS